MVVANTGLAVSWGTEHHSKEGVLISRQVSFPPPVIRCMTLSCLRRYLVDSWRYTLILMYHKYRTIYAEKHRNENIPEHYRTGDNSPTSIMGALWAIFKLRLRR